jgi:serine/threonine protein kinase
MSGQLAEGAVLTDYAIASVAGTGGMGVVYKATQRSLGRTVALKVIRDEIASQTEYRERFLREARLAASVDHPHVVAVFDVGEEDGHLFLAMQWIDGCDLGGLIRTFGPRSPDRAVAIASQVASALDAVHRDAGLVHRDVKPANVLVGDVDGKDHAYLTDFGVARAPDRGDQLTRTGCAVGTTGYMSPEQIMGSDPTDRSDLYALGCLFFETLTGQPPFAAHNEMAVRWAHAHEPRPKPSVVLPELGLRYDAFVAQALAVDPQHRFATGREFTAALQSAHKGALTILVAPGDQVHTPTAVGPPTPVPLAPQTPAPPPPTPIYPAYGYTTPPPPYAPPTRGGNPLALVLLGLVAIAGVAVGALAAAGVFSRGSGSAQTITSTEARHITNPPARVSRQGHSGTSSNSAVAGAATPVAPPAGSPTSSCGGDLSVGPNTTCGFARNVEQAYLQSAGGNTDVTAYSPATGQTYTMSCTGGTPHVCTGGTNASVYFTSGPGPTAPTAPTAPSTPNSGTPPSAGGTTSCGGQLSVGPNTTCGFAQNVRQAYEQSGGGDTDVSAFSAATGKTYTMHCTAGSPHVCTGANDASVYFP